MVFYQERLNNDIVIQHTTLEWVDQLEELQKIVFPTLSPEEIISAAHYKKHLQIFPEGQLLALCNQQVVGMTTTMRHHFTQENHTFLEISDQLWIEKTHQPNGDWLYGLDLGVHPAHRGKGIAKALYFARKKIANFLNLNGQLTVGMLNGFLNYKKVLSAEDYFEKVCSGEINDPTISMQMSIGFQPLKLIPNYLNDSQCDNYGVLMKW